MTPIHLLAFSGGAGIALFACEAIAGRADIETLVLGCPAVSPTFNLAKALRSVRRCYAWISHRDRVLLGIGTRLFGTTDRCFTAAAGRLGFEIPSGLTAPDRDAYERLREIHWTPEFKQLGHSGGHTGWGSLKFLRPHLLPILAGEPRLPVRPVGECVAGVTDPVTP